MNVSLLTILAIVYLVIAIVSIIYFILITFEKPDILFQEEFGKLSEEPFVSIIVPTYNEENNILTCLQSLKMLDYSNYEIILSDGGSADRTVELAKPYVDKVIIEKALPEGWIGKNYGCHIASEIAEGEILLFTDADTYHRRDSLKKTISVLQQKNAGLLSMMPYQRVEKWWESIVPIYFFLSHLASEGKKNVNDPNKPTNFLAIGQYLLFTREAYEKIGGHVRLKGSIIEDLAFARVVKTQLNSLYFMDSHKLVAVRMYPDSPRHMWTGFKKCLYAGTKFTPSKRIIYIIFSAIWAISSPITVVLAALYSNWVWILICSLIMLVYPVQMAIFWHGKGKHYYLSYLFFPMLLLAFLFTLIVSTLEILITKKTTWKGRTYCPDLKAGLNNNGKYRTSVGEIIFEDPPLEPDFNFTPQSKMLNESFQDS